MRVASKASLLMLMVCKTFFELPLDFGLFWRDNFEVVGCIFLQVFRFEWVPYKRDFTLLCILAFYSCGFEFCLARLFSAGIRFLDCHFLCCLSLAFVVAVD